MGVTSETLTFFSVNDDVDFFSFQGENFTQHTYQQTFNNYLDNLCAHIKYITHVSVQIGACRPAVPNLTACLNIQTEWFKQE